MEPFFPPTSNPLTMFWTFGISLAIFHGLFLYVFPLSKTGWKAMDYPWLAAAGLALFTTTAEVRKMAAGQNRDVQKDRVEYNFKAVLRAAIEYSSAGGTCAPLVRRPFSPGNFDAIVHEQQASCAWFTRVTESLKSHSAGRLLSKMPPVPNHTLADLKEIHKDFLKAVTRYNNAVLTLNTLVAEVQRTRGEEQLLILAPLLLAITLALRVTKVTGEIRLERKTASR